MPCPTADPQHHHGSRRDAPFLQEHLPAHYGTGRGVVIPHGFPGEHQGQVGCQRDHPLNQSAYASDDEAYRPAVRHDHGRCNGPASTGPGRLRKSGMPAYPGRERKGWPIMRLGRRKGVVTMSAPTWVVAPVKLVLSALRHPNTAQTMTIRDGHVEVAPDDRGSAATSTVPPDRNQHSPPGPVALRTRGSSPGHRGLAVSCSP